MTASRRWVGMLLASILALMGAVAISLPASAAPTSPFDPASNGATKGALTFYDASGNVVTSGSLTSPPKYVAASTWDGSGSSTAFLYIATPAKGVNAYTWSNQQVGVPNQFPLTTGAPADLTNKNFVIADNIFQWFDPSSGYQNDFPNTDVQGPNCTVQDATKCPTASGDAAWQDLYQVRMLVNSNAQLYASATIWLDSATQTWNVIYPGASTDIAPAVSTAAAITGIAKVGKVMTCSAAFTGSPTPSLAYQWKRGTTNITGATKTTYQAVAVDANKSITCVVTATNTAGTASSTSLAKKVALGDPLKVATRPTITGIPKVGRALTCRHGGWSPAAASYGYQWLRNGKVIKGKTAAKYKVVRLDKGKKISCRVTAKKPGYKSGVATTAPKKVPA